ncbi:MFS transporter [Bogoriella caseilytica]|nr:MFS transporter [Bogoriella caseilytica]
MTAPPRVGVSKPIALAVLCAAFFMGVLDSTSVFAALPSIGRDLGMGQASLSWVVTIYGVIVAGFMLPCGRLADLIGRRRVFLVAIAIFAGGSLACGLAASGGALIAARGVQALGAAALTPAALALLLSLFPDGPGRNRALAIWGGLGGIGATCGLVLGGMVTDLAGWVWIFYVNVPVCGLLAGLVPRVLPESRAAGRPKLDVPGGLVISGGLMLLALGLLEFPTSGWGPRTWAPLAGAAVAGGLLVLIERHSANPILPPRLFRSRPLVIGNAVILAAGICVNGLLATATLYTQQVLNLSPLLFGTILASMTIGSVLTVAYGQRVVTHSGVRVVAVSGMGLLAVAGASFRLLPADHTGLPLLLGGLIVFGAGMGAAFVAGQIAAVGGVDPADAGAASGIEETSFTIGCILGVVIVTAVSMAAVAGSATGNDRLSGLHAAFTALAVIAAAGGLASLTLPRHPQ